MIWPPVWTGLGDIIPTWAFCIQNRNELNTIIFTQASCVSSRGSWCHNPIHIYPTSPVLPTNQHSEALLSYYSIDTVFSYLCLKTLLHFSFSEPRYLESKLPWMCPCVNFVLSIFSLKGWSPVSTSQLFPQLLLPPLCHTPPPPSSFFGIFISCFSLVYPITMTHFPHQLIQLGSTSRYWAFAMPIVLGFEDIIMNKIVHFSLVSSHQMGCIYSW